MGDILSIIFFLGLVIFGICILFIPASIADEKGSSWTGFFYRRFSVGLSHSFGTFGF